MLIPVTLTERQFEDRTAFFLEARLVKSCRVPSVLRPEQAEDLFSEGNREGGRG